MASAERVDAVGDAIADQATTRREPQSALIALQIYILLRMAFPAKVVISSLGQVGSPATLWGLLCLFWYLASLLWKGSGVHRGRQPMRWAFGVVAVAWLLSYAVLPLRFPELFERNGADAELIQIMSMVGVGLLAADGLESREQLLKLSRFMCVVWGFASMVALLQFLGFDPVDWMTRLPGLRLAGSVSSVQLRGSFNRAAGTTSHPIEFATMTAMVLPMALQLQPYARHARRWAGLVLVIVLGIPASLSRSGFVGLVIGMFTIGIAWPRQRQVKGVIYGLGIAMVLFVTVPGLVGTTTRLFTQASSDSSITTRTDDYTAVQPFIEERPILGRGIGTFQPPRYRILDNQYLLTLIEAGAVGLAALLAFVVVSGVVAREAWCNSPPGAFRDASRAIFAAILVGALSMAFFDGFSFDAFASTLFLFAGMGGAAWRLARQPVSAAVSS